VKGTRKWVRTLGCAPPRVVGKGTSKGQCGPLQMGPTAPLLLSLSFWIFTRRTISPFLHRFLSHFPHYIVFGFSLGHLDLPFYPPPLILQYHFHCMDIAGVLKCQSHLRSFFPSPCVLLSLFCAKCKLSYVYFRYSTTGV